MDCSMTWHSCLCPCLGHHAHGCQILAVHPAAPSSGRVQILDTALLALRTVLILLVLEDPLHSVSLYGL